MAWEIDLHDEVRAWIVELAESDTKSAELVQKATDHLGYEGPMAGRSLVDRIKGGKFQNMKELQLASTGRTEIRMLFAFDPVREAIMPVAGDESGRWESRPRQAVPIADAISRNV